MFRYRNTGSGNNETRCSRNIERISLVAASAYDFHNCTFMRHRTSLLTHNLSERRNFIYSRAFRRKSAQETSHRNLGYLTTHNLIHCIFSKIVG